MINEKEFFEAIRGGDYDSMPKVLRELFIMVTNNQVVKNQEQTALTVNRYTRPTLLEDAIYKYNLQGISVTMITDVKKAEAIFTRFYRVSIDVPAFLSNLQIFNKVSVEQLEERYGNLAGSLEVAMKRAAYKRRKNETVDQETKSPREREILLFIKKFEEEKDSSTSS